MISVLRPPFEASLKFSNFPLFCIVEVNDGKIIYFQRSVHKEASQSSMPSYLTKVGGIIFNLFYFCMGKYFQGTRANLLFNMQLSTQFGSDKIKIQKKLPESMLISTKVLIMVGFEKSGSC